MAPEVLKGKGYSYYADLWSLGIFLYEIVCGNVPFGSDLDDPYETYSEILKKHQVYPMFLKDKRAKNLIDHLLQKTPEMRFGGSYTKLKCDPWFENYEWVDNS
jgi:cGMP-dependent protein kinase